MTNSGRQSTQRDEQSVLWWVGWITLTIVSFFVACIFWTPWIARHVGAMNHAAAPALWITAVFGSWMVLLVPLIVVMYNKVDRAYEEARIRREQEAEKKAPGPSPVKNVSIPESERLLSDRLGFGNSFFSAIIGRKNKFLSLLIIFNGSGLYIRRQNGLF